MPCPNALGLNPGGKREKGHKVRDRKEIFIWCLSAVPGLEITNGEIDDA